MNIQNNEETNIKLSNFVIVEEGISSIKKEIPELIDISDDNSSPPIQGPSSLNCNPGSNYQQQRNFTQTSFENMRQIHLQSVTSEGLQAVKRGSLQTVTKAGIQTTSEASLLAFTGKGFQTATVNENNLANSVLSHSALISSCAMELDSAKCVTLQNNTDDSTNNTMNLMSQVSGISLAANMSYAKEMMLKSVIGSGTTNSASFLPDCTSEGEMDYAQGVVMQNNSTDNFNNAHFASRINAGGSTLSMDHSMPPILQAVQMLPSDTPETSNGNVAYGIEAQNMSVNNFKRHNEIINQCNVHPVVNNVPVQNLEDFVQNHNPELHINQLRNSLPALVKTQNFAAYNDSSGNRYFGDQNQNFQRFLSAANQNQRFVSIPNQSMASTANQNQIFLPTSNQNKKLLPIINQNQNQIFVPASNQNQRFVSMPSSDQTSVPTLSENRVFVPTSNQRLMPIVDQNQRFVPTSNQNQRFMSSVDQNQRFVSTTNRKQIFMPASSQNQRFMVKDSQNQIFNSLHQSCINNFDEVRRRRSDVIPPEMLSISSGVNCPNPTTDQIQVSKSMNYNLHPPEIIQTHQNIYPIPGHSVPFYSENMLPHRLPNHYKDNSGDILRIANQTFESQCKILSKRSRRHPKSIVKSRSHSLNAEFPSMSNSPMTSSVRNNQEMNKKKAFHHTSGGLVSIQSAPSVKFNNSSISFPSNPTPYENVCNNSNFNNSPQDCQRNVHSHLNQMEVSNVQINHTNVAELGVKNDEIFMSLENSQNQTEAKDSKILEKFQFQERVANKDEVLNANTNPCTISKINKNDIPFPDPITGSSKSFPQCVIIEEVRFEMSNTNCDSNITCPSENDDRRKGFAKEGAYLSISKSSGNITESTSKDDEERNDDDDVIVIDHETNVVNADDNAVDFLVPKKEVSTVHVESINPKSKPDLAVDKSICEKVEDKKILLVKNEVDSIPMKKATSAYKESRFSEFFEIVRTNTFASEYHQELRTMWVKAQILNHHKITKLPVTARYARSLKKRNPPPETIAEKE